MPTVEQTTCFFVADLHGKTDRYQKLFAAIETERPAAVFLGGDLLPSGLLKAAVDISHEDFINDVLVKNFSGLRDTLKEFYPKIFLVLGNDDARFEEAAILDAAANGIWHYVHDRKIRFGEYTVYGYAFVPPSPFLLKDWERYDVSRFVDPGCVSPEEGHRTIPVAANEARYSTIKKDLQQLAGGYELSKSIFLFHTPPYKTKLDRAALDNKIIDHVPMDVHVGSIAVRRFIKARQPLLTLHGHIHESARLTGSWQDRIGKTRCFSAAHDGPELALVRFTPDNLQSAQRELL